MKDKEKDYFWYFWILGAIAFYFIEPELRKSAMQDSNESTLEIALEECKTDECTKRVRSLHEQCFKSALKKGSGKTIFYLDSSLYKPCVNPEGKGTETD
tara:strand:- start:1249 stop:1545 length:297 start_codon:yes stop_codon:yes gene_type:complete